MQNRWFWTFSSLLAMLFLIFSYLNISVYREMKLGVAEVFVMEEYVPADIVIDGGEAAGYLTPSFSAFAQGGEEMRTNMLAGTEQSMKAIAPRYVRLDHIFDDDYYELVSGSSGNLNFNFSKLDGVVDSILAMGAKPFFSLGYMPKAVAENKITQPANYNDWYVLTKKIIEHYSIEKGIEDVYYEVWNEPDLESFGSWKYFGDKSYLTLYGYSARAAAEVRASAKGKKFKIGGPGITALYKNWVLALVNYCESSNLPLDFISWHRYSYYPSVFEQDMKDAKSWLEGKNYELIISEWGPDSEKTNVYSSLLSGVHAAAVMERIVEDLDWGFAFEVKDGPMQDNFGWGMFYYDLRKKPRYNMFMMMSDMYGDYLKMSGEGSSVRGWAIKEGKEIRVILVNYDVNGGESELVPVEIKNAVNGEYNLNLESLKGNKKTEKVSIVEGKWKGEVEVSGNEVIKLTLSPKNSKVLGVWDYGD